MLLKRRIVSQNEVVTSKQQYFEHISDIMKFCDNMRNGNIAIDKSSRYVPGN